MRAPATRRRKPKHCIAVMYLTYFPNWQLAHLHPAPETIGPLPPRYTEVLAQSPVSAGHHISQEECVVEGGKNLRPRSPEPPKCGCVILRWLPCRAPVVQDAPIR